ncbi:hypothetical protein Pyn_31822 [Prunus yedoensis var. nudiflora]|uniref:Uncharacterized protein n=1 Tax=Prunus yedoensis var. nudiflora TaxID=2094558 RepID=A0A314UR21_PRUYE|nr:hypothetical protein Pyn_31822 [Prunus yedoensis var. nudiflora]
MPSGHRSCQTSSPSALSSSLVTLFSFVGVIFGNSLSLWPLGIVVGDSLPRFSTRSIWRGGYVMVFLSIRGDCGEGCDRDFCEVLALPTGSLLVVGFYEFLDQMDLVRSGILNVGRNFSRLRLLVAISFPISLGSFVVGIWDLGGDRAFTVVEPYFDKFAEYAIEGNLKGSPNSP